MQRLLTSIAATIAILACASEACPSGYTNTGGYCFRVSVEYLDTLSAVTYAKARELCRADAVAGWKTDLVMLKDTKKLEALGKHILEDLHYHVASLVFWVGAKQDEQGNWKWVDGDDVNLKSHIWFPDQPPADKTDLCMRVQPSEHAYRRLYATVHTSKSAAPSYVCEAKRSR